MTNGRRLGAPGSWVRCSGSAGPLRFFDNHTNAPRAVPRVLTRSERAAL